MSTISVSSPKTHTLGSGDSAREPRSGLRRRRTKLTSERKIADDEFMAAAIGDVEWLKQSLRDSGPEINFDKNGLTAIHLAAIHGRLECLKVCVEKFKIDINLPSSTGWRPVHLCISNQTGKRSLQCLAYLLQKGADSSITNDDGITPAHQAASEGHVQCLKLLLEIGAKIDTRDCRGNTPLDLAKLWGHRKCARILAAEMWHQDKDSVAKEMHQLKKVKMQQVLRELEDEEEMKAAKQFYGDEAFKQWLANKQLSEQPAGPLGSSKESKGDSLYKANSVARKPAASKPKSPVAGRSKIDVSMDSRKLGTHSSNQKLVVADEMTDEELIRNMDVGDDGDQEESGKKKRTMTPFHNDSEWNKSTKVQPRPYVPNLKDDFPRDEYTMMPQVKGVPKYYEGKFVRPLTPTNVDEDVKRKGSSAKLRKPKLPDETVDKELLKNVGRIDRGMLFKCRHIGDVHAKKKYDIDDKGRSEAPLHLMNDATSWVFLNSIVGASKNQRSRSSGAGSTSSKTTKTEWTDDNFPLPIVMQALRNMNRPTHFPNINGNEYMFSFKNVK